MSRLLLLENHHAGDAVLAVPFLRGARRIFSEIAVCCTAAGASIFRLAGVENLIPLEGGSGAYAAALRQMRAFRPDAAAAVWADVRLHGLMRLSGAKVRAGFPMSEANFYGGHLPWRQQQLRRGLRVERLLHPFTGDLLTHRAQRTGPMQAHLDDWNQLAELLGATCDMTTPWFPPGGSLPETVTAQLRAAREAGRCIIALHHGGRLAAKRWPAEQFEAVARGLTGRSDVLVLAIEPPDVPPLYVPGAMACRTTSLAMLVDALAACDILLCNDSLASHLAAAVGTQVVSIFGPGHPDWFAPHGSRAWAVHDTGCPFNPCLDRCLVGHSKCLEAISADRVATTLDACLRSFQLGKSE